MEAHQASDFAMIADALNDLRRPGWSIGVVALTSVDVSCRVVWQVDGRNGENLIRSSGATEAEAWRGALDQARSVGILGRWRV
jgi:hypothetical protein